MFFRKVGSQTVGNGLHIVGCSGANRNPKFRNSEIVRIGYLDGQQLILSDNFGQTQLPRNFLRKILVNLMLIVFLEKKTLAMSRLNIGNSTKYYIECVRYESHYTYC